MSVPISKLIRERAVCAPKYRSAGTSNSPMVSFSILISPATPDALLCSLTGVCIGAVCSVSKPFCIIFVIVADLPSFRPFPTLLSSFRASSSGILILIMRRSPARCLAINRRLISY